MYLSFHTRRQCPTNEKKKIIQIHIFARIAHTFAFGDKIYGCRCCHLIYHKSKCTYCGCYCRCCHRLSSTHTHKAANAHCLFYVHTAHIYTYIAYTTQYTFGFGFEYAPRIRMHTNTLGFVIKKIIIIFLSVCAFELNFANTITEKKKSDKREKLWPTTAHFRCLFLSCLHTTPLASFVCKSSDRYATE